LGIAITTIGQIRNVRKKILTEHSVKFNGWPVVAPVNASLLALQRFGDGS
jgi:hypothetical protein